MIMDKTQLLNQITTFSEKNQITKEEVLLAFNAGHKNESKNALTRELGVSEMLYFIGGFIVFVGIAVLISQNWNSLGSAAKILVTLGFGVVAYCSGLLLNKEEKYGTLGAALHFIAALVLPIGLWVAFNLAGFLNSDSLVQTLISGMLFAMYFSSYFLLKKSLFLFFTIAYGTWLFFALTNFLIGGNPIFSDISFYEYRFLFAGLTYLFLGYYFSSSSSQEKALTGPLYGFGSLFVLGATLALGGWSPHQNLFWELLAPLLIFAFFYLSVYLKAKSFLTFGTCALMLYVLKITGEYFAGSFGWPIALVTSGLGLIVIGYYAFTINKKYLSSSSQPQK